MGKIYEHDSIYSIFRPYVDFTTQRSFREIDIKGAENIPADGVVIFAPNHCNTLMDALVVLRARKDATVFGARADIFNKASIARILHFLRILPIVRKRDGIRNVVKNKETIDAITEVLENDVPFCIFSEGTHRPKHSLLPIGKGIARMAFAANEKFGDRKNVYIVPVGLEYGDYFRFRSTSLLTYGQPINVTEIIREHSGEGEAALYQRLRNKISERVSGLITYIDDDEKYEPKWALVRIAASGFRGRLEDKLLNNRKIASLIEKAYSEKPAEMEVLYQEAESFEKDRVKFGVSIHSFGKCREGRKGYGRHVLKIAGKTLGILVFLPFFAFSATVSLPIWLTAEIIRSKFKDKAFGNSVRFGARLALYPITLLIWSVLFFIFIHPWYIALIVTLLATQAYSFFYDYLENLRLYVSDILLLSNRKLMDKFFFIRKKLGSVIELKKPVSK